VARSCERGNETSGSIIGGEFLGQLSILLASQEGLCSTEIVMDLKKKQYLLVYAINGSNGRAE
jgi:hypothetical protein